MRAVKVTYSNGESITTDINGTDQEILDYFKVGKSFNLGKGEKDDIQTVVKAEILPDSHIEEAIDANGFNPDGFDTSGINREDLNAIIDILIINDISYDLDGSKETINFDMTELSKEDQDKINLLLNQPRLEKMFNYSKSLFESKKLISDTAKPKKNKMHSILGIDKDKKISDIYTSGKKLAEDLVKKVGKKKTSSMLAFVANINKEENIYDKALRALDKIEESIKEGLKLTVEYEGEVYQDEVADDYLVDIAKIAANANDFVKKVTYGITDQTEELHDKDDKDKLINWYNTYKNLNENKNQLELKDAIESFNDCIVLNLNNNEDRITKFDIIKMYAGYDNCEIIGVFENKIFIGSKDNNNGNLGDFKNNLYKFIG